MEAGCVVAAVIENAASGPQRQPGSCDVLEGDVLPPADPDKDDKDADGDPPAEKPETCSPMVRSDDITELPAEPLLRSCVSTASMKVKNMKKLTFPRGHFPRLAECAHFHYETVDFGNVQLAFAEGQPGEGPKAGLDSKELVFLVQISCQARSWLVKRSYEDFRVLDKHLHLCIYDRRYSQLAELPRCDALRDAVESGTTMLATYLSRLSAIADNKINCGPVLTWMEVDNKGNHLLVSEEASINVPAIAAAHVTKRYTAQATDELTFEVGDIVSVIDMPPKEDTGWWRGKHGFQVGFFPCDCVELINDKIPPSVQSSVAKPVCKKHGKLVTFLRTFMKSRPPPQKLRQRGILRERVFGCDLGEYLHNSGHEVPQVVKSCADFIEKNGVTDGIYRLSGISSNIQKLRHEFDSEQVPDLSRDVYTQDIHSVGSLCKLYFRELPNPLLTYQLYDRFSEAVSAATDEERLVKIHNVIQQLPPPHYRTLEYLMRHLSHLATFSPVTNMHTKNLAIVWAPNLLRSRQIESACFSGTAAFMEVRIQSVVVEFILNNTEALFSTKLSAIIRESTGNNTLSRPKSLLVCSPSTKLLTLEEAQARTQAQLGSPATTPCLSHSDYIEVGEGPGALLGKFHTVIELPMESGKRPPVKAKKSPVGNWLSFFHLGKSSSVSKRKLKRHPSEPNEIKSIALPGGRGDGGTLRSTKSEESLTSLLNVKGEPSSYRPRRPRSTSEALSDHRAPPLDGSHNNSGGGDRVRTAACISPPHQEDDLDLCPPAAGIYSLDFDPMSFQCSPLSATPGPPRHKDGSKWRKSESEPVNNNGGGGYRSPDVSPVLGRESKKVASKPLSPKLRKKSFKMQADVPPPPPPSSSSRPLEKCDAPPADGKEARAAFPHCSPVSVASISDISQPAANLPDPGADRLMSSVSVLPPHPPLTSAARKLALALAESAQKASSGGGSQRRHDHQVAGAEPPHGPPDRPPPRPSVLDLKAYPQEHRGGAPWQTSARSPAGGGTHPGNFLPAHLVSEESNFTPNVSPLGSGSLDEGSAEARREGGGEPTYQSVGVSTPTQPTAAQTPSPSPVYVNTDSVNVFNFRAVLAETSMPASIDEVIPRPLYHYGNEEDRPLGDDVYSNHHHHRPIQAGRTPAPRPDAIPPHILGPKNLYRQSSEGHYSTLGLRPPSSPQCRRYRRDEHLGGGGCHGQPAPWQQRTEDRVMCHPAIRRARSFHAPQISHYELAKAEAPPPPDAMFYMAQTACQEVPYQRLIQTGVHPVRQQFESADYRYDLPDAGVNARYYVEPCRQQSAAVRHSQSYSMRSRRGGGPADYYDYSPRHAAPVNRELYIESRDTVVYQARDAEVFVYQPLTQEVKSKRRNVRPAALPYESPVSPGDARNRDIMHTRSKSDPGNACLVSAGRTENVPAATSPNACRSRQVDLEVARQPFGHPAGPSRRIQIKETSSSQQAPLRKIPSLPEHNNNRGHDPERFMTNSYAGAVKPSILRRSGRSQSTRENRHYYHYHAKSPLDPEQPGSFSTQPNRRTQSTKVRPTQYDHKEGYYAAPRLKPSRSGKAGAGYLPGVSPRGHRLLSNALRHEAFYHGAMRSEAGVYD